MERMDKSAKKSAKEKKLKSALRDNLKKRKQFSRKLESSEKDDEASVKLRAREISAKNIDEG